MTDYMKEAKILYLADVLEDIAKEMEREYHNRPFCKSINDIVKDLRETLAFTPQTYPTDMQEERIQIKRIGTRRILTEEKYVSADALPRYYQYARESTVDGLLHYIREEKLIRVRKDNSEQGDTVFTASLIVGIEKEPDTPKMVTSDDILARHLEEAVQELCNKKQPTDNETNK